MMKMIIFMVSFPLFILKLVTEFAEIGRRVHVVGILSSNSTEPEESNKEFEDSLRSISVIQLSSRRQSTAKSSPGIAETISRTEDLNF